jgi:hypothetical protein
MEKYYIYSDFINQDLRSRRKYSLININSIGVCNKCKRNQIQLPAYLLIW